MDPHNALSSDATTDVSAVAPQDQTHSQQSFNLIVEHSIHGRVAHGACFVHCASSEVAEQLVDYFGTSSSSSHSSETEGSSVSPSLMFESAVLRVEYAAGKLRDHLFPKQPFHVRRHIRLDPEATFSVTDEESADRMTALFQRLWLLSSSSLGWSSTSHRGAVLVDATACVGGNTLSFAKHLTSTATPNKTAPPPQTQQQSSWIDQIIAIEANKDRFEDLLANVTLMLPHTPVHVATLDTNNNRELLLPTMVPQTEEKEKELPRLTVVNHRMEEFLTERVLRTQPVDVFFCDPPWGGPQYGAILQAHQGDLPLCMDTQDWQVRTVGDLILQCCGVPSIVRNDGEGDERKACSSVGRLPVAPIVAFKLPSAFDTTELAKRLTAVPPARCEDGSTAEQVVLLQRERNFPFRFHFGLHTTLLVVLVAGNASRYHGQSTAFENNNDGKEEERAGSSSLWFTNSQLNTVIAQIMSWHHEEAYDEHRPEYFDYDKQRWIMLKKWIPSAVGKGSQKKAPRRDEEAVC